MIALVRRAVAALAVTVCLALPPSAGAAVDPIVGLWESAGAKIRVDATFGFHFQGTVVSGFFANCPGVNGNAPGGVIWKQMTGGGYGYSGKIPWVKKPQCTPLGDGQTTFTLTSVNSGTLTSTSPDGGTTDTATMTRVGTWAGGDGAPPFDFIERARRALTNPCDVKSAADIAAGKGDPDGCAQAIPKRVVAAQGAGALTCAAATGLSGAERFTPITTGKQVSDCLNDFPAPKAAPKVNLGRARASAKRGTYKGFTTPVGTVGSDPTRKQLLSAAKRSGTAILRGSRPPSSNKISLSVAGAVTTIRQSVVLRCVDGTKFKVTVSGVDLKGRRGFKASGEEPVATAVMQGRFLTAKLRSGRRAVVVGALYLSVGVKQHGACASFVAFAARGPRAR